MESCTYSHIIIIIIIIITVIIFRWICSHNSPCGDLLPKDSGTPEYCLLLEASNL